MLVELALGWLRRRSDSALTQRFNQRFRTVGMRMRRVGIIALARRLAKALWRFLNDGVIPEGAPLKSIAAAT